MQHKVYSQGWCYFISGNTDTHVKKMHSIAESFANEIGVEVDSVIFDGVINERNWLKGFQLFGAPSSIIPDGYEKIDKSIWQYIKKN